MIDDILDYVVSYDDIRAVLGVPEEELSDGVLALTVFRNHLGLALEGITGTYPLLDVNGDRDLTDIFTDIGETDQMYQVIQMYALYIVADCVANTLPMIGVKTKSEGKSVITRHSAESVYTSTQQTIKDAIRQYSGKIKDMFGETVDDIDTLTAVGPAVDVVTGE